MIYDYIQEENDRSDEIRWYSDLSSKDQVLQTCDLFTKQHCYHMQQKNTKPLDIYNIILGSNYYYGHRTKVITKT